MRLNPDFGKAIEEIEGFASCKPGAFEREAENNPEIYQYLNDRELYQRIHQGIVWDRKIKHVAIKGRTRLAIIGIAGASLGLGFNLLAQRYGMSNAYPNIFFGSLTAGSILMGEVGRIGYEGASRMAEETREMIRSKLPPHELR